MVTLEKIRKDMKDFLAVDNQLQFVEVMADSIGDALEDASVQLDVKTSSLQYEIVEKGSEGFMGLGKKPWKLKIYPDPASIPKVKKLASDGLFDEEELAAAEETQNREGFFIVRHFKSDIMLKIILPTGDGEQIDIKDVIAEVSRQDTIDFDEDLIKKYANELGAGIYTYELDSQFRCNGSDGYIAWLNNLLEIKETANFDIDGFDYDFKVFDDPNEMRKAIEEKNKINNKSRIVAGYCWDWIATGKTMTTVHDIVIPEYNFEISWNLGNSQTWAIDPESVN